MYPSNRKRPGRKCVLETEIPPELENKIRSRIVSDRRKLRNFIDSHANKKRNIETGLQINPKTLDDTSLRERIKNLERTRGNLLRIVSLKNELYSQFLERANRTRSEILEREVVSEKVKSEEVEKALLAKDTKHFSECIGDLVKKISKYKEEHDKANNP
ncbi:hypothetical protein HWI79_17 [Cryptosporidium felis]|nr:hypothetical protein HWI79_17 [Cryptosporidium felis]